MFGFGAESEPYFNEMAYIHIQCIAIDDYNKPDPGNILDEVQHPVNPYNCK